MANLMNVDNKNSFSQFLLAEYDQIATAHFKAGETLASFFKHFLVIAALPLSLFALVFTEKVQGNPSESLRTALIVLCFGVSVLGLFVLCYLSNLWFDQALYARTLNSIRGISTSTTSGRSPSRFPRATSSTNSPSASAPSKNSKPFTAPTSPNWMPFSPLSSTAPSEMNYENRFR